MSRTIIALAADAPTMVAPIDTARAAARARVWAAAGADAPNHDTSATASLVIDFDAALVTAHSDRVFAVRAHQRGFGLHTHLSL